MNKAFHIWKYDNFAHRASVRKAVVNDKEWQEKLAAILPLLDKQHMEIAYMVPWCELGTPPKEGVYELVTYQLKPGGPALWGNSFKAAIDAHVSKGYAKLIGFFHTEYGFLNTVHVLWWFENPDIRATGRHMAHEDARVVAAVRENVQFLETQQNMLLIPASFSPLNYEVGLPRPGELFVFRIPPSPHTYNTSWWKGDGKRRRGPSTLGEEAATRFSSANALPRCGCGGRARWQ
ncbi:protein NipSnap 3B-like [Crotalus adamanteus]|uniref:Protein NipSnap 3B-like n=1 Tax=Crotalus adamanteus TaxID=8729 RepID=A0AAW1C0P6_CROAD